VLENTNGTFLGYRRAIRDTGDQPGEPERGNIVKYVSPEFGGFVASAAWGADDYWDMALRYKADFAGFKLAAGIAYGKETTEGGDAQGQIGNCNQSSSPNTRTTPPNQGVDCEQYGGSLSVMHTETGLYVNFAAGESIDDNAALLFNDTGDDESTFYSIEGGIERKFVELGKTTIFGQYYDADTGSTGRAFISATDGLASGANARIAGADLQMWGGGIVQGIDAAAMSLYLYYRHVEADFELRNGSSGAAIATPGIEDLDIVVAGGIIKF
jgi:predicted porin